MDCNFTLCKRYLNGNCIKQVGEKCQLEQAKKIIKEYIRLALQEPEEKDMIANIELFKKAEQFLEEIEK